MLSATEIACELRKYQHDTAFRSRRRIPLTALARVTEVGKQTIFQAAQGKRISDRSRLRLSLAIKRVKSCELRLRRHGRTGTWVSVRIVAGPAPSGARASPNRYFDPVRRLIEQAKSDILYVDRYMGADFVAKLLPLVSAGVTSTSQTISYAGS